MLNNRFDKEIFLKTIKYTSTIQIIIGLIFFVIWLMFNPNNAFPFSLFTLGMGGLILTSAGCVGPGRYKRKYNILMTNPSDGASFSEVVIVSGFILDELAVVQADIMVNNHKVGVINFIDKIGKTVIPREKIIEQVINSIWLKTESSKSNKSFFTFFEYTEDLTDEEIEEFVNFEKKEVDFDVNNARNNYIKYRSKNVGSIAWGLAASAVITMSLGIFNDLIFI